MKSDKNFHTRCCTGMLSEGWPSDRLFVVNGTIGGKNVELCPNTRDYDEDMADEGDFLGGFTELEAEMVAAIMNGEKVQ